MEIGTTYYAKNLNLLRKHHPRAWQVVTGYNGQPPGELCLAEDNKPTLLIRKEGGEEIFLHDPKAPESELARYYALVPEDAPGVVVFVGMGLGYTPLAMLRTRRQICILALFEPETGTFIQALHALDLESLLTDNRVTLAIGQDIDVSTVIGPMAKALQLENIHILTHTPSFLLHPATYQALHDEIYKQANSFSVGGATTRLYGQHFINNRLRHVSSIHHQQLVEHLQGAFAGIPAIIVAGGPSLNKNIHLLPAAKGKAVIIAADTVLPALLAHGVTPDFTTSIDMVDITHEKIVDVSAEAGGTALICASWVTPLVTKNFPARQVYWSFAGTPIEKWLNSLVGGKLLTTGAGTVAHLSFTSAVLLGCSPIVFVGQDLAYTADRQDHAQQASLTTRHAVDNYYATNEIQWVEGYGGVMVPTTRDWLSNKHHFEQSMAITKDRKFINATEGGVRLEGTEELPLQEVLARYCHQVVDIPALALVAEDNRQMAGRRRMIDEFERMIKTIVGIEKDMVRLDALALQSDRAVAKLQGHEQQYANFESLPLALKRQIIEVDALNSRLDKAKPWELLDEVTRDGLLQSERLNQELLQLADQPALYLEWLRKSIARFVLISQCRRQVLFPFKKELKNLMEHLQRETLLLHRFAKQGGNTQETLLELLRLHYDNGDYVLLEKMIASHCLESVESAEISFYLGVIAAHQSQFHKAEQHFARAVGLEPSWAVQVAQCRYLLAERYLDFGRYWQTYDRDVAQRLLFKGVRHTPECPALREALAEQVDLVLTESAAAVGQGLLPELVKRLAVWCRELTINANLGLALGVDNAAALFRYQGNALIAKQEFAPAADSFAAAIGYTPQVPDLYILHADALFALNDMAGGMASLDRAVAIDPHYAQFWENMGDNLLASNKASVALGAFEKCFLALPERIGLLKKIGDCYLVMEQSEAAREAYRIYQEKSTGL